ncbi:predicted protein [Uncinocarpus reesii 1704]|uniref:Synaptobrevin n=1 Tax=Uncinocarpus reesii (strain UAMH 1704) TaxID=336963 RepID=C4JLE7_UNCRE|nr:uncharacterized protein UREG_03655 [Uncinocarpus reesii 1704]EEP78809.1 predicted protein [Uncinocarpus reesii 1704]
MTKNMSESYFSSYETINLSHLLSRLQAHLLSPSADLKLLRSKYHRARMTARQLLKALRQRIDELAVEAEMLVEDDASSSEDEDILPTPEESTPERRPSLARSAVADLPIIEDRKEKEPPETANEPLSQSYEQPMDPCATSDEPQITSTLRSRHPKTSTAPSSHSTAIPTLSSPSTKPSTTSFCPPSTADPSTSKIHDAETALTTSRLEQDSLTDSLLSLAMQLKASSQTFHSHLESEKSILSRATEGLDRNTTGMEAAGKRMGALRRMTEGRGWWGRVLMYLWIFGLWIVAVLIVFVGPKLRF